MPNQDHAGETKLAHLLETLSLGELSEEERQNLVEQLSSSPSARADYIRAIAFNAMLASEFPSVDAVSSSALRFGLSKNIFHSWPLLAAMAAIVLLGLGLEFSLLPNSWNQDSLARELVLNESLVGQIATVTQISEGSRWRVGDRLTPGKLELEEGRVEITFDCGAVVTIVAPVRLELLSEYRGFLYHGQLSAHVPPQADGFVIQTPTSHIRDLGTAFALRVENDGNTDVHVYEGSVEATSILLKDAKPTVVLESNALRFSHESIASVDYDEQLYSRLQRGTEQVRTLPDVHWSFDDIQQEITWDSSRRLPLRLKKLQSNAEPPCGSTGVFSGGLRFVGHGGFAESSYSGVAGDAARTVAFWLKLPSIDQGRGRNCIVSWGLPEPTKKWEVAWNRMSQWGALGAIRLDFGKGCVIGSTDLRDDLWHHVAVVYHGGSDADVSTHLKLYVDGRLETVTGRRQQKIVTDIAAPNSVPLTLGRFIDVRSKSMDSYFIGDIDELHIFTEALRPSEIVRLMKSNTPYRVKY